MSVTSFLNLALLLKHLSSCMHYSHFGLLCLIQLYASPEIHWGVLEGVSRDYTSSVSVLRGELGSSHLSQRTLAGPTKSYYIDDIICSLYSPVPVTANSIIQWSQTALRALRSPLIKRHTNVTFVVVMGFVSITSPLHHLLA